MSVYPVDAFEAERVALLDDEAGVVTYGDLVDSSRAFADAVEPHRLVVVLTRNTLGCLAGCISLMNSGAVPLLLDATIDRDALLALLETYRPEYLYVAADQASEFAGFERRLDHRGWCLLASGAHQDDAMHPDLALLLPTSGSTGSPKLVRQSRDNLRSNGASIIEYLGLTAQDRPITSLPTHYTYGFSVLNSHLLVGATVLVTERSVIEKGFWSFFADQQASSLAGVPYTYQMLQRLRFMRMPVPALRTMTQAGGKMAPALIEEFATYARERGIEFFVMYGQTEATARMSYVPSDRALEKAGSIGVPIPGGDFFIVGESGQPIDGVGEEGELGYRGPNVTLGYATCREDLTKGDERGGTLLTGDLAVRDDEGYFYVTGRSSRYIKLFGKRVSLDDLEQLALTRVPECACVGGDDDVQLWISGITNGTEESADAVGAELKQVLSQRTGIHPSVFTVRAIEALPHTSAGKIDYRALVERGTS